MSNLITDTLQTNTIQNTNGITAMSIDSAGRITYPNRPYFYARGAEANFTITNGSNLPFTIAIHNVGGFFNTSTYYFTAPVAGLYLFTWSIFVNGAVSGRLVLKVNNTSYNNLQMDFGAAMSQAATLFLNKGDLVSVGDWQSISGGVVYMGHSHFSGILMG